MQKPQAIASAALVVLVLSLPFVVRSRQRDFPDQPTTAQGIALYQQGKAEDAVNVLRQVVQKHGDDVNAWYYLGLAQFSLGWIGNARASFEKTVALQPDSADALAKLAYALILANESKQALVTARRALELGDQSSEAHYAIAEASLRSGDPEKAVQEAGIALLVKPDFAAPLITQSFAQISLQHFPEAAESLERFLALAPDDLDAGAWRQQLEELRTRTAATEAAPPAVFTAKEVTQKVRILSKPAATYSEAARKAGVSGTVAMRAVFSADGEVTHFTFYRALGFGLTTQAVKAAQQIKFTPAIKDGHPVSMFLQLEYTFNLL